MRKTKKKAICLVFSIFFFFSSSIFFQTKAQTTGNLNFPINNIFVDQSTVLDNIIPDDREYVEGIITKCIQKAFDSTIALLKNRLNNVNNNSGAFPTERIKEALRNLLNQIETGNKIIIITFYFNKELSQVYSLKNLSRNDFLDPDNPSQNYILGDHTIAAECSVSSYLINLYNAYFNPSYYVANYKNNTLQNNSSGCIYKFASPKNKKNKTFYNSLPQHGFEKGEIKTFAYSGVILHELIHIALFNSPNKELKTRYADEATVEDILLHILPENEHGYNVAEYQYSLATLFYVISNRTDLYQFDTDGISREFNPPSYLHYKDGNGIFYVPLSQFNYKDKGFLFADDARDEELKNYILPYTGCPCNNMMAIQTYRTGMTGSVMNSHKQFQMTTLNR